MTANIAAAATRNGAMPRRRLGAIGARWRPHRSRAQPAQGGRRATVRGMPEQSQIGVTGLAVMGANLARNIARHGFSIAVHNRTAAKTTRVRRASSATRARSPATESLEEFVAALERPRRIIIMVKAGAPVDARDRRARAAARRGRHRHRRRQLALRRHAPPRGGVRASAGCASSAPASPAARRARCSARASCPAATREAYGRGRGDPHRDRRAGRRRRRAASTSARTAPATT